jgi:hypothetical protein
MAGISVLALHLAKPGADFGFCDSSLLPQGVPGSPHSLRDEQRVEPGPMEHSALGTSSAWVETRRGSSEQERVSPTREQTDVAGHEGLVLHR